MKLALSSLALLISAAMPASALADTFKYECKLLSDYSATMKIEVSEDAMKIFDQADGFGGGKRGTLVFLNQGLLGGRGKMKDRLVFTVDRNQSQVAPNEITSFFLAPALTTGGERLRNGRMGGYLSFNGQGYSYESYICFQND